MVICKNLNIFRLRAHCLLAVIVVLRWTAGFVGAFLRDERHHEKWTAADHDDAAEAERQDTFEEREMSSNENVLDDRVENRSSIKSGRLTCDSLNVGARVSVVEFVVVWRSDLWVGDAGHDRTDHQQNEANQATADWTPEDGLDIADFRIETTHRWSRFAGLVLLVSELNGWMGWTSELFKLIRLDA